MQAILERNKTNEAFVNQTDEAFGSKIGVLAQLFGCWHKHISRPFTIGNNSYRACLDCGARKPFDAKTLKTYGSFHYPPAVSLNKN
jgi:hypothetical protein